MYSSARSRLAHICVYGRLLTEHARRTFAGTAYNRLIALIAYGT